MISFIMLEDNNTILIENLKQTSSVVNETIVIKESQLQRIIRESIKKVLNII
jgi:hypothetical protein